MLDTGTKTRINTARDILVGKVPDPKAQVEQITTALIYKFMHDMDQEAVELGGKPSFFVEEYAQFSWSKLMDKRLGGHQRLDLYVQAITRMGQNPHIPQLFRDIFKDAFLPYRDPETLNLFLKEIDGFTYDHSERLGDAFEYLLSVLGSQGAAGQFRTPRHIIDFIVQAVAPSKTDTILDPACGTAGFLISAFKHIMAQNAETPLTPDERQRLTRNFVGYDISPDMVRLSLVNMYLHQFPQPTIYEYDTLTTEDRWDDSFDVILANPPFMSPKGGIRPHQRFAIQSKRSEVLFVDYIAEHLNPNGRAGVIVPEGIIFQSSNAYKRLRKMLVDDNYLWAVVSLPAGMFNPYSGVKTSILLMDKPLAKRADRILFVDVQNDGFGLGAQRRKIDQDDLPQALQVIWAYQADPGMEVDSHLAHAVSKEKIAEDGDYNLSGGRYKILSVSTNLEWQLIALDKITETFIDGNWIERKDQSPSGIRLIQTGNVGVGEYLDKSDKSRFITEETFDRLQCTEVLPGDILISRLPDPVGRSCIVPNLGTKMITAVDCTIVRFDKNRILPKYFHYLATSKNYFDAIKPYLTGAVRKRISRSNLGKVKIPVPPIEIQRAIVEEIDTYQAIIDGARQVVENWKPSIDFDPEWPLFKLDSVCSLITDGTHHTPKYTDDGIPFLRVTDITKSNKTKKFISEEEHHQLIKRCKPEKNDILYTKNGTIGVAKAIDWDWEFSIFVSLALLKIDQDRLLPKYGELFLNSDNGYKQATARSKSGTVTNLHLVEIKEIEIPVPDLDTQERLVAKVEHEQALVESNRQLIDIFQAKIDAAIARVWGE